MRKESQNLVAYGYQELKTSHSRSLRLHTLVAEGLIHWCDLESSEEGVPEPVEVAAGHKAYNHSAIQA